MFDIKIVKGRTKKEALESAKMDYGDNFTILSDKTVKTGGFMGIGQKEMCQVSIALFDNKLKNDTKEIKKHEPIDGERIAEGILNVRKNILQSGVYEREESIPSAEYVDNSSVDNILDEGVSVGDNSLDSNTPHNGAYKSLYNNDLRSYRNKQVSNNTVLPNTQATNNSVYSNNKADKINTALSSIKNVREQTSLSTNKAIYKYIDNRMDGIEDKIENKMRSILSEFFKQPEAPVDTSSLKALPQERTIDNNNMRGGYKAYNKDFGHVNTYKIKRKNNTHDNKLEQESNALAELVGTEEKEVYLEVNKQKIKNKNSVIDNVLEKVRKKEFPDELIEDIRKYLLTSSNVRFIQSESVVRDEISRYFEEKLILQSGIQLSNRKKIVILVGPTGVGKTTTIPKLAAPHIRAKRDVCFLTLDNYRIAAGEQLAKYASIIKIPFATVKSPDSLRNEIRKMGANSVLFIDTIGRSPKATKDIIEMSTYFSSIGRFDIDINLLLSATLKYSDALNIMDKFSVTNYKSTIITKLDETNYLAPVLGAIIKNKIPISSITYGQSVPNDISDAVKGKNRIIKGLYGGSMKC